MLTKIKEKAVEIKTKIQDWDAAAIVFYLGCCLCLFYAVFFRHAAQIKIDLPFLNFPIFIGEIYLGICVVWIISIRKKIFSPLRFWHGMLFLFIGWILYRAYEGCFLYEKGGVLALRNAALYYYSLFAIVGYYSYKRERFSQKTIIAFLAVMLLSKYFLEINDYFVFPYLILSVVFVRKIRGRLLKCFASLTVFFTLVHLFQFQTFDFLGFIFSGSRSKLLGHIIAIVFLFYVFIFTFLRLKSGFKILFLCGLTLLLIGGVHQFADPNALKSVTDVSGVIEAFKTADLRIQQRENFEFKEIPPKLYAREKTEFAKVAKFRVKSLFSSEETRSLHGAVRDIKRKEDQAITEIVLRYLKKGGSRKAAPVVESEDEEIVEPVLAEEDLAVEVAVKEKVQEEPVVEKAAPVVESEDAEIVEPVIAEEGLAIKEIVLQHLDEGSSAFQEPVVEITEEVVEGKESTAKATQDLTGAVNEIDFLEQEEKQFLTESLNSERPKRLADISRNMRVLSNLGPEEKQDLKIEIKIQRLKTLKSMDSVLESVGAVGAITAEDVYFMYGDAPDRNLSVAYNNILFRVFIWRDMLEEIFQERPFWGFSFGKPQRSKSLEILVWARGEWGRDGWITPHNSFLHIIYRAGVLGVVMVVGIFIALGFLTRRFIIAKSITGVLLTSVLIYWVTIANFLVFLEFPYHAIPFWSLFGMTFAYSHGLRERVNENSSHT